MYSLKFTRKEGFNFLCLLSHKWEKVKDSGATAYWECKRCRRKEIIGYEEDPDIDYGFIFYKEKS